MPFSDANCKFWQMVPTQFPIFCYCFEHKWVKIWTLCNATSAEFLFMISVKTSDKITLKHIVCIVYNGLSQLRVKKITQEGTLWLRTLWAGLVPLLVPAMTNQHKGVTSKKKTRIARLNSLDIKRLNLLRKRRGNK